MRVIFENKDILAVDKPAGQPVIRARGFRGATLQEEATDYTGGKIWIVHRIDQDTSGVVLVAKNAEAHRRLCLQFEERRVSKKYSAVVAGEPENQKGLIDQPIREFGSGRMGVDPNGKPSQTRYKVREAFARAAWLEVEPLTGRRHQIRAHLFSIGHPVLGDRKYGAERPVGGAPRLMLHAGEVRLALQGERPLVIAAGLPGDFQAVLVGLRSTPHA